MMKNKIGDKRVQNNDFQQYEKCLVCKKGFWATSEYELGNWKRYCPKCDKKNEVQLVVEAKKNEAIISRWNNPQIETMVSKIDDEIRQRKKSGELKIIWPHDKFRAVQLFAYYNGYNYLKHKKFTFMGVEHFLER